MLRLLLSLLTLGLGAVAYSLLRTERQRDSVPDAPEVAPSGPRRPAAAIATQGAPRRCAAVTRSGKRCTREVEPGAEHCWQHGG